MQIDLRETGRTAMTVMHDELWLQAVAHTSNKYYYYGKDKYPVVTGDMIKCETDREYRRLTKNRKQTMLVITVQKGQAVRINLPGVYDERLIVTDINKEDNTVGLRLSESMNSDFTMEAGKDVKLTEHVRLFFKTIDHYTSKARDVDHAVLGFEAPRTVIIRGEWMVKGNR